MASTTGRRRSGLVTLAILVGMLVGCGPDSAGGGDPSNPSELVLGLVPALEANKLIDNLKPLEEYLSAELGIPVRSFVPQDYTGLVEALGSGRADIGMLPPFAAMLGNERYGIETILISEREGESRYRSQWMTRDPGLCEAAPEPDSRGFLRCNADLEVVRDQTVAFTDPTSTSGYLFPSLQLLDLGINPEEDIRAVFVGGHDAAVIAVLNGDVDIGAAYDDARTYIDDDYPDVGTQVIVFASGPWIPNDGVQVRGDLSAEMKERIKQAFVKLTLDEAHLPLEDRLLYKLYEIDGFVEFEEGLFDPVRRAFREMRDKIDLNS